eukprot:COSAG01_NODE_54214_length_333_cov_1.534188_1_plen_89_part_10
MGRLWRGAMVPVLAALTACPAAFLLLEHYGQTTAAASNTTAASVLRSATRCNGGVWVVVWWGLSFGVVVSMVPFAAAIGRLYMPHREVR